MPEQKANLFVSSVWVDAMEQSFMVLLILGRWLLPKGDLTHEQVSSVSFLVTLPDYAAVGGRRTFSVA